MKKDKSLVIVPKDNHEELTGWFFAVEDMELAQEFLEERYPNGTHEVIEVETEYFETSKEFEDWTLEHHGYN